jgi:two-component system response regulator YesN
MNLMIVEDELRLLNHIARNIHWEEHGIEVAATAWIFRCRTWMD